MWQLLFLLFVFAEASSEESTVLPTYQPLLPTQGVDLQLLPGHHEPLGEEDTGTLDLNSETLLTEAVRLLQIDNIQNMEKKLFLTETSLKEKGEEVQMMKIELEATKKSHILEILAMKLQSEKTQAAHDLEVEEMTSAHKEEIQTMKIDAEKAQEAHDLELEETQSKHKEEIDAMKLELENTKQAHAVQIDETRSRYDKDVKTTEILLQEKIEKSWTLVNFMMEVLKKSEALMKSREEMIMTQAGKLKQVETNITDCREKVEESLRMMKESQKVIHSQRKIIEDLKTVVTEESSLNGTYHKIKEANLLKSDCDIPPFLTGITEALTTQQKEIEELKQAVAEENNVADLLTEISKDVSCTFELPKASAEQWDVLGKCQGVVEEQFSSLDFMKTLASYGVTRNNSLRYKEDEEGHLVSAGFCQCLPNLPELQEPSMVSLNLVKYKNSLSTQWSAWQHENCEKVTLHNGTNVECGEGRKTRRRLKDLNAETWEEEVEEVACQFRSCGCFVYKELYSPTRKSTHGSGSACDSTSSSASTSNDWRGAGWYRITGQAGYKLADSRIAPSHCGTAAAGWLTGGHPTVAQGEVARTVKFEWTDGKERKAVIKVMNCGKHYVYHLAQTPQCTLGYCTK